MKTNTSLLFALATAALFGFANSSRAQALLSPKAAGNVSRVAPAGSQENDPDLRKVYTGKFIYSPKTTDLRETMTVGTLEKDPDLIRSNRAFANLPPKLRDNPSMQVQIAPLK